jgi:hypothetical protein
LTPGKPSARQLEAFHARQAAGRRRLRRQSLDVWLREKFFEQHAKRFHHRPFIWHVWDGLKDGFGALVNYHKLDAKNLERLIHTYLGDWIRQQEAGVRDGIDGAQTRLAAAAGPEAPPRSSSSKASRPTTSSSAGSPWPNSPSAGTPTSTTACASTSAPS